MPPSRPVPPTDSRAGSPSRRTLLAAAAAFGLAPEAVRAEGQESSPGMPSAAPAPAQAEAGVLQAAPGKARFRPDSAPETPVWCFDGKALPPVVRVKLGQGVRLKVENRTDKPLSLHWHGVRNVNAMDGVGGVTQAPIAPGGDFLYAFTPPDAGSYLIRPLVVGGASEPSGRGLAGMLVVEEANPPVVDADVSVVLQDWRLQDDGTLMAFGQTALAAAHGRLGNLVTVNGKPVPGTFEARPGSRVRLRLGNACNARATRIKFEGVKVYVAAVDGQPTDTFEPLRATLPFPPGTRYDLMVDLPEEEGARCTIEALVGKGLTLASVTTKGARITEKRPPIGPIGENKRLPAEIKLQNALRRDVVITGGAFVPKSKDGTKDAAAPDPVYTGDPQKIWSVNGASGVVGLQPIFSVKRGQVVVLALRNETGFPQALHLHGHCFRLLHPLDDGWEPYWLDTFQLLEGRTARIGFLADNPGRWLISATVLERFDTGLWTLFEVT
ncbi:multicopper oxidase family protein [Methylobacterium sp. PvR107]|uniref:multicopper oxidase family protein n=1 Tax=Methylobacterium sp. PvR107 TaxID=2806597 RepID=UPI001AE65FFF|nr:multicopper oxidase family protein [Methylobacterium sp. PvR107]MBP1182262.1 FtsP/CotA-like multicopper oxidase with cupredoxin domain [Methylobacterium sp. PvR107]